MEGIGDSLQLLFLLPICVCGCREMDLIVVFYCHLTNINVIYEGWYALGKVFLLNWFRTCFIVADG